MSTALFTDLSSYFNNIDPEDPVYQKELIRPAEIKEDVKLMEQRRRVSNIMRSKLFKKDLENIFMKYKFDDEVGSSTSNLSLADISEQLLLSAIPKNKIEKFSQLTNRKGTICINDLTSTLYGKHERQTRCKLASIFRLIHMYGWNSQFDSALTTRLSTDKDQFLINPFGLMFHEITASSLISVDFKGNISDFGSTILEASPLAWMIHSAIYLSQSKIRTILELKTPAAVAISSLESGLLPICRESIILGEIIILHQLSDYINKSKSPEFSREDLNNCISCALTQDAKIIILPKSGFLVCGDSIEEAWHLLMNCQIGCETQLKLGNISPDDVCVPHANTRVELYNQWRSTDLGGVTTIHSGANNVSNPADQIAPYKWKLGELEFEALMRHLDNNGYRTGHLYRQETIMQPDHAIKTSGPRVKYEVEIPPSTISTVESARIVSDHEEHPNLNKYYNRSISEKWFHTPNKYRLVKESDEADHNLSYNEPSDQTGRKLTRWESAKAPNLSAPFPQHPVNAGAYVSIGPSRLSKSDIKKDKFQPMINPKELIENQKRVKNKYYYDTNTAGPISCLLDSGLSREEVRTLKTQSMKKQMGPISVSSNDQVITSASKGIIQRGHKAVVYQDLYKPANPFDVTEDELANYHKEIDRKHHPEKYKNENLILDNKSKETPEIQITVSQTESSLPSRDNETADISISRPDTEMSRGKGEKSENSKLLSPTPVPCDPFFQSDFDEDFSNYKLSESACTSSPKKKTSETSNKIDEEVESLNVSGDNNKLKANPDSEKASTLKSNKKKSFRSFSFKLLGRSKSTRESAELLENKSSTLAAPGYGTITSETSGLDISNDEFDKDSKPKKKKSKFKLPSFSKKKKDKSK